MANRIPHAPRTLRCVLKAVAAVLIIALLTPTLYSSALGQYGDPDFKGQDTRPIQADDESQDVKIEIDESLPSHAQNLRKTETFPSGDLADRGLDRGDQLIADGDEVELYFNEETLAFKMRRKASGYVWSSALDEDGQRGLSRAWKGFSTAPVALDYIDEANTAAELRDYPDLEEARYEDRGVTLDLHFPRVDIRMTLSVTLSDDDGMTAAIKDDSIEYLEGSEGYAISYLYLMPFFGAVDFRETEGYLFVPDGPGALIRFQPPRDYNAPFRRRVYGDDEGVKRRLSTVTRLPQVESPKIHMPVFGISHGDRQEAFVAVIDEGADYATIQGSPAGVRTYFYWNSPRFSYYEVFFQPTGRGGEGFPYATQDPNIVNPKVTYYLLGDEAADYTGMARRYRRYLDDRDMLPPALETEQETRPVPLYIQAFMAEQERGLFFNKLKVMTHIDDVKRWLPPLHEIAGSELALGLYGAQPGGYSGHDLGDRRIGRKVGGSHGMDDLKTMADEYGIDLLIQMNLATGFEPQLKRRDMIYHADRSIASRFTQNFLYKDLYFMNMDAQLDRLADLTSAMESGELSAVDISDIGETSLSDYRDGHKRGRHEIRGQLTGALNRLSERGTLFLEAPHSYYWSAVDAIYNTPSQHSQLLYETDTVPFLQVVLSGLVPLYSRPLNFGAGGDPEVLRMIDYDLYPAYQLTQLESSELRNANTQDIYFSQFDSLLPDIRESYAKINDVLGPVRGAEMIARHVPRRDVSITDYSNGMTVIVNYSDSAFEYAGETIPAEDARVLPTNPDALVKGETDDEA